MIDFSLSAFLAQYHLQGLTVGLATFLIIGLFHPVVIKCHYRFGTRCWWWFLLSILAGVVAFSSFWTIKEVFEQEERVRKGWFPANPARSKRKTQ